MKESEGNAMKKDIEWAQKEVDRYLSYEEVNEARNALIFAKGVINQLDEPEVLSQEWIRNNQERKGVHFFVKVTKLQNLLVPKQGELETKIHELIESYKQEEGAYSNPENGWISGFIEDLKNLVEEEQKYYVNLDTAAYVAKWNGNDQVDIYTDGISGSDEFEFHLTEQEIKNYDERFWPFAEPVE